jgi:hypothetical protein
VPETRNQLRGKPRPFKGRQFNAEVILWAVRWYLMFPISYRDLELMLQDRGVEVGRSIEDENYDGNIYLHS